MWRNMNLRFFCLAALIMSLAACQQNKVINLVPEIINTYPHDSIAFTQGLLLHEGKFFESTGLFGQSDVREVEIETGTVNRLLRLDADYFAEGLARVDNKLYQITWQSGEAFVYDLETFSKEKTFSYETEGWGLCFDGEHLYMTDGTSSLFQRDPDSFEMTKELNVTLNKEPITNLNELECVADFVYANVWQTDQIVKIDKRTGVVVATVDASNLLSAAERSTLNPNAVLNGIAYNPEADSFYVTGKLWSKLFEVRFVEQK